MNILQRMKNGNCEKFLECVGRTAMEIYDQKVNHLVNPLGFRMRRTVFSWKVRNAAGKKQAAARIKVAKDKNMSLVLVDTGWDETLDSLGSNVLLKLDPVTRYYWQVSVRSDAGEDADSEVQWFETGKMNQSWKGKWITCDNQEKRHPYFEKEINPSKPVKNARLYICGLGLYEAYYNGKRIGDEYLTPYSNDYTQWVQYQSYDVTSLLQESGKISVLLGNGWYKGRFGFDPNRVEGYWGKEWKLIGELQLFFEDGTTEIIGTDESWSVKRSNIIFSNIYDGEHQDDTLEELPTKNAVLCTAPEGELCERMSVPVRMHEKFKPIDLIHTPAGEIVLDLGQEFAGIFSIRVHEPKGTKIHIQTGEILQNGNFYNENLRSAKSEYIYISDGEEHILIPHFTWFGYRYVKVEGIEKLKKEDFTGIALYSEMEETGKLKTGNQLVNRLIENVNWGLKSNFLDVPTDCPQRDERLGWTGDAQVFSPTAIYLKDAYSFYAKYLYDMGKEQSHRNGKVPDVVPSPGLDSTACVWGDAACIMPWNLYLFYGDKSILEDQYDSMKSWVEYIRKVDGNNSGWRYVFHYGDWLALDNPQPGPEQVMGGTDEEFIANLYYAVSAGLVAKAALLLGKAEDADRYQRLSDEQFDLVKKEYYSCTGRCCIKTQTALILTLKYHLSENEELVKRQLRKLFEDNSGKLKTGFVGTPLMCNVLSDNGMEDIAYGLLLNEEYPGWLYEVKLGATTIWERWNSLLPDGTISGIGMNSMNHYSYGSIVEWMFRYVAGINTRESAPGLRTVFLEPTPNWELRYAEGSYDSASGCYSCGWKLIKPDEIEITVKVPFNGKAELKLPYAPQDIYNDKNNSMMSYVKNGICTLESGTYYVHYKMTKSLKKIYTLNSSCRELLDVPEIKEYMDKENWILPKQYVNYSIREAYDLFPTAFSEEMMRKLEEFMKNL